MDGDGFQPIPFNTGHLFVDPNAPTSKAHHAFNLLGCIVVVCMYASRPEEARSAVDSVYGPRDAIFEQIHEHVMDASNKVVHDLDEKTVTILRSSVYPLVKGENVANEDRILNYFVQPGGDGKVSDANIRKYFSGLKDSWERNKTSGQHTYLRTFDYVCVSVKECQFVFKYE